MQRIFLVLLIACQSAFAQKEASDFRNQQLKNRAYLPNEFKNSFANTDFSLLFTKTENESVFGFIGDDYQRIRVKIISVSKSKTVPDTYDVYGKSMVKTNIDKFHGTLRITNIRKQKEMSYGADEKYKSKGLKGQFMIIGDYSFSEPKNEKHSGVFKGVFESDFYLDRNNKIHYDDIDIQADGYSNNEFVGYWVSHDGEIIKRCNWGDYRIPNAGNLDIGAGDFSPADKYLKNDWQTRRDYLIQNNQTKKAKAIEQAKWWL